MEGVELLSVPVFAGFSKLRACFDIRAVNFGFLLYKVTPVQNFSRSTSIQRPSPLLFFHYFISIFIRLPYI